MDFLIKLLTFTPRRCVLFLLLWAPVAWWIVPAYNGGFPAKLTAKEFSGTITEFQGNQYGFPLIKFDAIINSKYDQPVKVIVIKQ